MQITVGELRFLIRESLEAQEYINEGIWEKLKKLGRVVPLLTISLGAVGCNYDYDTFKADGFNDEDLAIMQAAADEWCEQTGNVKCAVIGKEGDSEIKLVAVLPNDPEEPGITTIGTQKYLNSNGKSKIQIKDMHSDPAWESKLYQIVAHELGHHFRGVGTPKDHLDKGNIMSARLEDQSSYITTKDVDYAFDRVK